MYVCIYIYVHIYTFICVHICISIYIGRQLCVSFLRCAYSDALLLLYYCFAIALPQVGNFASVFYAAPTLMPKIASSSTNRYEDTDAVV